MIERSLLCNRIAIRMIAPCVDINVAFSDYQQNSVDASTFVSGVTRDTVVVTVIGNRARLQLPFVSDIVSSRPDMVLDH